MSASRDVQLRKVLDELEDARAEYDLRNAYLRWSIASLATAVLTTIVLVALAVTFYGSVGSQGFGLGAALVGILGGGGGTMAVVECVSSRASAAGKLRKAERKHRDLTLDGSL